MIFDSEWLTEYLDGATALVDQRTDNADCRRLPGTVGSQQCIEVTGLDREVDALERLVAIVIGLGEVLY